MTTSSPSSPTPRIRTMVATPGEAIDMCRVHSEMVVASDLTCLDMETSHTGHLEHVDYGSFLVSRHSRIALRNVRSPVHIARDGNDAIYVYFNADDNVISGTQFGRDYATAAGEGGLYVYGAPNLTHITEGSSLFGVTLPRAMTLNWRHAPEDCVGRPLDQASPALAMFKSYVRLLHESDNIDPVTAQTIRVHVAELAGLWLGGLKPRDWRDQAPQERQTARVTAVYRLLEQHFSDPTLNTARVAAMSGLSERMVQHVLTQAGTSFSQALNKVRVEKAFQMLRAPDLGGATITDVAFTCGFNDLSAFYRTFKKRYDEKPTAVRTSARY